MQKEDLKDYSFDELIQYLKSIEANAFHADQICDWIYKKGVTRFEQMTNLPLNLRRCLEKKFSLMDLVVLQKQVSGDKTIKFLFELTDRERIETLLIPTSKRNTLCMSTQVGCKYFCKFCASGIGGWKRNLTCSEILGQILSVKKLSEAKKFASLQEITHIVFMGVGEPLDNYDNLLRAIRLINAKQGLNIGARRITISTCGLIPKIKRLAQEGIQIELSVSLHGSNDAIRDSLMPVNKKYPIEDLMNACREYVRITKRQITFEYVLIKDLTCSQDAAKELGQLLRGLLCMMNLIPYNKISEFDYESPSRKDIGLFQKQLKQFGIHATVRTPRGKDINGACGQLRHFRRSS